MHAANMTMNQAVNKKLEYGKTKPLPFKYQFAAGAVAGISEILVM